MKKSDCVLIAEDQLIGMATDKDMTRACAEGSVDALIFDIMTTSPTVVEAITSAEIYFDETVGVVRQKMISLAEAENLFIFFWIFLHYIFWFSDFRIF